MKELSGLHIGFCGIDGAGKTTQMGLLYKWMKDKGIDSIRYEESRYFVSEIAYSVAKQYGFPSGQEYFGEDLYAMAMSFEVLRKRMLEIEPYTQRNITIISSRTAFDWLAGFKVRGCSSRIYSFAQEVIFFSGCPDVTFWLDTTPEVAYLRIKDRGYDYLDINSLRKFREAFLDLAQDYKKLVIKIPGDEAKHVIHKKIIDELEKDFV